MCTVTLTTLPEQESGFVLTSNRDEAIARKTLPPMEYLENGVRMFYPKDELAGGTWIGLSEKHRLICLLNGGFKKHVPDPPYRKSRGVVVKELLGFDNFPEEIESYDLDNIEPFTCIVVDWKPTLTIRELVWDGKEKHLQQLSPGTYIWSSSLLYSEETRTERELRFRRFTSNHALTPEKLLNFHSSKGTDGLIIDKGFLKTCSITQVTKTNSGLEMSYQNLLEQEGPVIREFT